MQAVQFGAKSLGEEVMGAGAGAKRGRGPRGRHAHHQGVVGGHDEVLTLGRRRDGRTAASQASPALRDALIEHREV
jgi:hypothetical protein